MKILVTGFEPFGGESINPAAEILKQLPETINGAEIITMLVPVVRYRSIEMIKEEIQRSDPDVILSLGQAGGRAKLTVERVGINVDDQRIPDNDGKQVIDEPIYEDGPDAYFVSIPVKKVVSAMNNAGVPAAVSNTAGTFICNHVLYGVRYWLEKEYPQKKSGFIHVPFLPSQSTDKGTDIPSMSLEDMVRGITAALYALSE